METTPQTLAFLLSCLILGSACELTAAAGKPNVLFIVCDDLNTHVTTSGYPHIQTPAFEKLAASGMSFGRAYCQYPVCGPSRASFLSGLYPESAGVTDNTSDIRQTRPGTVSLPQIFKENGYWTASTGKIFHNPKTDHGEVAWNEVTRFENDEMPIEAAARKKWEAEHGPITEPRNRKAWREFLPTVAKQTRNQAPGWGPSGLTDEQHRDGKNARQTTDWLDRKSYGDKPFFIAVGIHKPHVPYLAPDKYFELYPQAKLQFKPAPPDFWKQAPKSAMDGRYKSMGFELGVENDPLRREYMQAYHACITFIDAQIGLIFESLKKNGQWDNTIIVLTSDHGYQLGEHFMWGKVTLFEVCNRVPFIVRVPGMTTDGSSSRGLVELVDLYPTLTDLCGVPSPEHLQGKSLVPMLKDPSSPGKELVYTVVSRGKKLGKAVRTQRWRYSLWPDGEELYNLKNDIEEHHNLANSTDSNAILRKMRRHLAEFEKSAASSKVKSVGSAR
jgi:iduronate 2-sulfatase